MKTTIQIFTLMALMGMAWGSLKADSPPNPDVVTLKDGRVLQGQIVEETDDNVTLSVNGINRHYDRDFITSIRYGEDVATGSAKPQAGESSIPAPRPERLISRIALRYNVTEHDVLWVRDKGIPDEDLDEVFWVAARAEVRTGAVVKLRLEGWSWREIENHFGIREHYEFVYTGPPPAVTVAVVAPVVVPRPWLLFRILFWPFLLFRHLR